MCEFLRLKIEEFGLGGKVNFVEPFCGGAGAALNLLADGFVDRIYLNDADIRIYSAWRAMLTERDRFVDSIHAIPLTIDEWYRQQDQVKNLSKYGYSFELGFASFFMNRTTRSGIVEKAGPIGGYQQTGQWKLDARFNREGLAQRVDWLAGKRSQIELSNKDALAFIDRTRRTIETDRTLFFIDPPYVKAGGRLYLNGMTEAKHVALSDMLTSGEFRYWVLTYDDAPLIRTLYCDQELGHISVTYSLQSKRKENEIIILPSEIH